MTEVKESYYSNGSLSIKTDYLNGEKHGVEESYDNKGNISARSYYKNGRLHGVSKSYAENIKDAYMEIPWKDGKVHGIGINRYEWGNDYFCYLYGNKVTKEEYREHELTEELSGIK